MPLPTIKLLLAGKMLFVESVVKVVGKGCVIFLCLCRRHPSLAPKSGLDLLK